MRTLFGRVHSDASFLVRVEGQIVAVASNDSVDRTFYAVQTGRRMAQAADQLQAILQTGQGDLSMVLCRINEQLEASRSAGFKRVWQMCQEIADYLTENCGPCPRRLAAVVTTSLEACQAIQLHAEAIAECALYHKTEESFRRRNGAGMPDPRTLRIDSPHEHLTLLSHCPPEDG